MTITELTQYLTPAEQGIVGAIVDTHTDKGDDWAFENIAIDLYWSADLDLDMSAAERLAYSIVHNCKRV